MFWIFGDKKYIYVEKYFFSRWWEKYHSKRSLIKHNCSWRDKLIALWKIRSFLNEKFDGNMIFTDYWKKNFLTFWEWKKVFFNQKLAGKIIFTDYWKVLALKLLVMGSTVFSSAKQLMKWWYLLALFEFFMVFQDLKYIVFCTVYQAI